MHRTLLLAYMLLHALVGASPALAAADGGRAHLALKGIQAVTVEIDGVHSDWSRYGLDYARLQSGIEERLRAAHFLVLSGAEAAQSPAAAVLKLRLRMVQSTYYYYSYSLQLEASQKLALAGGSGAYVLQPVWSEGGNGTVLPEEMTRLNAETGQLVDRFIAEHGAQNAAVAR